MLSEPPGADPHAGWCGRGQGKPGLYPIGDVVFGLSRELELRGNPVEIVLAKHDCLRFTVGYQDL